MFEQRGAAHSDAGIPLPRELTFRWPSTGALRVTESVSKQGTHVRLRYLLQWMHKGTDLVLHFDDVEFLEVLGGSADTQDDRKRIVDALSTMGVMPAITIDAEGQLRDVRGMEDLVDRALRLTPSRTAKDRKKLIEWMKSGHMQALVKQRAGMTWAGWAGSWAGFEVPASGTAEVTGSVTLGETTIEGPTVVAVRSAPEGRVLLLRTIVIENQEAKAAAAAVIRQLAKGLGVRGSPPEGLIRDVKFTSVAAIETDPATLVPAMVSHGVRNEVTLDGERHLFEESHEYAFAPP
jgi:hypothetical protein